MIFLRHSEKFPISVVHCERELIISSLYFLLAVSQTASLCLIASFSWLSGFNSYGFFSISLLFQLFVGCLLAFTLPFSYAGWLMLFPQVSLDRSCAIPLHFQYGVLK